jgi:hypothetical protein
MYHAIFSQRQAPGSMYSLKQAPGNNFSEACTTQYLVRDKHQGIFSLKQADAWTWKYLVMDRRQRLLYQSEAPRTARDRRQEYVVRDRQQGIISRRQLSTRQHSSEKLYGILDKGRHQRIFSLGQSTGTRGY